MGRTKSDFFYEAILFMQQNRVVKQMHYREFEAILDQVVGLPEYADQEASLVFVELDKQLNIRALVFFQLYFDETGQADPEWNMPLRQLAKNAGPGPDMGAGPIRLCCRSQCPINWHQKDMWDPSMKPGANDFLVIRRAMAENRLGFQREETLEPEPSVPLTQPERTDVPREDVLDLPEDLPLAQRAKTARLLREQRLRIKTLVGQHQEALAEVNRQARIEIQALRNELQGYRQRAEQFKVLNEQQKTALEQSEARCQALRNELDECKRKLALLEKRLLAGANGASEKPEVRERLEAELAALREQLERRDLELISRDEREELLRAEIDELKEAIAQGGGNGTGLLRRLADLDVVFMVYHPGAGHISIPPADAERYLANPTAYAAEKCFVTEPHYRAWLEHYEHPACSHRMPSGDLCGAPLERVTLPNEFVPGQDNRCEMHQI